MCKRTKNLPIQIPGVLNFQYSGWRFLQGGGGIQGGRGFETPVGAMLWDI